jgi:hypothetical protein
MPATFRSVATFRRAEQAAAAVERVRPLAPQVVEVDGLFVVEIRTHRRDAVARYLEVQLPGMAWDIADDPSPANGLSVAR